jgi:hypothetical protein
MQIVEHTYQLARPLEANPGFLQGLPHRRAHERLIPLLRTSSRKGDMTAPRISLVFSALNKEHFRLTINTASQQNSDSSPSCFGIFEFVRLAGFERSFEARDPLVTSQPVE